MGVPKSTCNAKVLFIAGSQPLCSYLNELSQKMFFKISYPLSLNGIQFTPPDPGLIPPYRTIEEVPSYFWLSEQLNKDLPNNPTARRALLYEIFDLFHFHTCRDAETHHGPGDDCRCKLCGNQVHTLLEISVGLIRYSYRETFSVTT